MPQGLMRSVMNKPTRWPLRVVISSPTMTSSGSPRSCASRWATTAASIRSWSVMAITSRCRATAAARTSSTPDTPSEARVWMCRSATPRSIGGSQVGGGRRRSIGVDHGTAIFLPDAKQQRPPLLWCRRDEALEGARPGRRASPDRSRRVPSVGTAIGSTRPTHRPGPHPVDCEGIHRRAGLDSEHRRARRAAARARRTARPESPCHR